MGPEAVTFLLQISAEFCIMAKGGNGVGPTQRLSSLYEMISSQTKMATQLLSPSASCLLRPFHTQRRSPLQLSVMGHISMLITSIPLHKRGCVQCRSHASSRGSHVRTLAVADQVGNLGWAMPLAPHMALSMHPGVQPECLVQEGIIVGLCTAGEWMRGDPAPGNTCGRGGRFGGPECGTSAGIPWHW